jgi:hypothetical protein
MKQQASMPRAALTSRVVAWNQLELQVGKFLRDYAGGHSEACIVAGCLKIESSTGTFTSIRSNWTEKLP